MRVDRFHDRRVTGKDVPLPSAPVLPRQPGPARDVAPKRSHEQLYRARRAPEIVEVPPATFLVIDGRGDPDTSERFPRAIRALYSVVHPLIGELTRAAVRGVHVAPLEGLWAGGRQALLEAPKDEWRWTLLIRLPDAATLAQVERSLGEAASRNPELPVAELRVEEFVEGLAAQVMHVGPYDAEAPTLKRLHAFIAEQGYRPHGRHHEIYLGDPRRAAPARLKTLLRQPVVLAH